MPSITKMRLRTTKDEWGQKLKLAYQMSSTGSELGHEHEVCVSCNIGAAGERADESGSILPGGTCGGFPNGCAVVKDPAFGSTVTIALRSKLKNGEWSHWTPNTAYATRRALVLAPSAGLPRRGSCLGARRGPIRAQVLCGPRAQRRRHARDRQRHQGRALRERERLSVRALCVLPGLVLQRAAPVGGMTGMVRMWARETTSELDV